MAKKLPLNFYEIQRQQRIKSLFVFLMLILFYFVAIGFISLIFLLSFGLFLGREGLLSQAFLSKFFLFNTALSIIIASFHFLEARKFGADFILRRLDARPPDLSDRYHKQFVNTMEEIRLASRLPKVTSHVLPSFAINSLAVVGPDNTPNVIVTEGLLAEFTRDELQAVVSHELAHILRGDAFYMTLVCSLANFFERLKLALEPEPISPRIPSHAEGAAAATHVPVFLAVTLSSGVMHLLSTLISRQREIMADATAVELCRHPKALARAIYKAHLKNSFVGDFNLTYSPLFIVPPESSRGESDGFFARLFNSHPPLMRRIKTLASMSRTVPARIIDEVLEIQKRREESRTLVLSREEIMPGNESLTALGDEPARLEGKIWSIRDPKGNWEGPYSLDELLYTRFFSPLIRVKNLQEEIEAQAREFPQVQDAIRNIRRKKFSDPKKHNRCPRCHILLKEAIYEGVPIMICPRCSGKLVDAAFKERIIARKEVKFSDNLTKKADEFKQRYLLNPIRTKKISPQSSKKIMCPHCGSRMLPRPYSYHYVIPVDKCFSCQKIWFDADELEILQILIEKR